MSNFNASGKLKENAYCKDFIIRYSDVDARDRLSPGELINILQTTCINHSAAVGLSTEYFISTNTGWALSNWHITINSLPKESQKVSVSTWSKGYRHTQAHRDLSMRDEEGIELVHASTRWVLMDLETRHPISNKGIMDKYCFEKKLPYADEKFTLPDISGGDIINSRRFTVMRSDLDINDHTNNAAYIKWAMDDVPDIIYFEKDLREIFVKFSHESGAGTEAYTETRCLEYDDGGLMLSTLEYSSDGELLCTVVSKWQ